MIAIKPSTGGASRWLLAALTILACLACGASSASALSLAEQAGLAHRFTYSDPGCNHPVDPINVVWEEEVNASSGNRVSVNSVARAIEAHDWPRDEYESKVFKVARALNAGDIGYQWVRRTDGLCVRDGRQMSDGSPAGSRFHVRLFSTVASDGRSFVVGDAHRDQKHQGDGCDTVNLGVVSYGHAATSFDSARNKMSENWPGSRALRYWGNTQSMRQCDGSSVHSDGYVLYLGQFATVSRASAPAPENISEPTISGTPKTGSTLSVSPGTWTTSVSSFSYQWCRVNLEDDSCTPYAGATGSSWTPGAGVSGSYVGVMVTPAGGWPVVSNVVRIDSYPPPTVTFNPVTNITENSATLSGTINQNGTAGHYMFECGATDASYSRVSDPAGTYIAGGTSPVNVSWTITGLDPGSGYYCLLGSDNAGGVKRSNIQTFTTPMPTSYSPPESPGALLLNNNEMNVYAREAGTWGQLGFGRATNGVWTYGNISNVIQGVPKMAASPAVINWQNGTIEAFAPNTNGEMIEFAKVPGGQWFAQSLSAVTATNPKVVGTPTVVEMYPGQISVFTRTPKNELISFDRTTSGGWTNYNITGVLPTHPHIVDSPAVVLLDPSRYANTIVSVFGRNENNELISFDRQNGGTWSTYNVSAVLAGSPRILGAPSPIRLDPNRYAGSGLTVFARNEASELISFDRQMSGGWTTYNISAQQANKPKIASNPAPIRLDPDVYSGSGLSVFARNPNNELISFDRFMDGGWVTNNQTYSAGGGQTIVGAPSVVRTNPSIFGSGLSVFARSPSNDLISFDRQMNGGWTIYNETVNNASGHPKIE